MLMQAPGDGPRTDRDQKGRRRVGRRHCSTTRRCTLGLCWVVVWWIGGGWLLRSEEEGELAACSVGESGLWLDELE